MIVIDTAFRIVNVLLSGFVTNAIWQLHGYEFEPWFDIAAQTGVSVWIYLAIDLWWEGGDED